jgi:hypothetical protein
MNAERSDFDRALRTWFEDGPTVMSDRVVDVIADRIARQPQRRAWRLPWRLQPMSNTIKLAAGVAAALVVAVVAWQLLPGRGGGIGSPVSTATAAPSPTTAASQAASCAGVVDVPAEDKTLLEPCRYRFQPYGDAASLTVEADIPVGWFNYEGYAVGLAPRGSDPPSGVAVSFLRNENGLYSDPCHWDLDGSGAWEQDGDVEVGPTVRDLVDAVRANTSYASSPPRPVAFGPYEGQELEIRLPADLNLETCDTFEGEPRYRPMPDTIYAQGDGNIWRMFIVDVAGTRVFPTIVYYPGTPAADLEAAEGIIDSIEFSP